MARSVTKPFAFLLASGTTAFIALRQLTSFVVRRTWGMPFCQPHAGRSADGESEHGHFRTPQTVAVGAELAVLPIATWRDQRGVKRMFRPFAPREVVLFGSIWGHCLKVALLKKPTVYTCTGRRRAHPLVEPLSQHRTPLYLERLGRFRPQEEGRKASGCFLAVRCQSHLTPTLPTNQEGQEVRIVSHACPSVFSFQAQEEVPEYSVQASRGLGRVRSVGSHRVMVMVMIHSL